MRNLPCLLFIVLVLFCGCSGKDRPVLPDKDLETIVIRGRYAPDNKERAKAFEKELRERGRLREGEAFEDRYPHIGKEYFNYSGIRYCYNKTEGTELMFDDRLRARLYDKEDQILTEDFLRVDGRKIPESQSVISYVPYHNEGYTIRIVRLEGIRKKEVILADLGVAPKSMLIAHSFDSFPDGGFFFDKKSQCHIGPGPM